MSIQLHQIAAYAPYGLTGIWKGNTKYICEVSNVCLSGEGNISFIRSTKTTSRHEIHRPLNEFKPILRPKSDLLKWITVKDKRFFPAEVLWSVDAHEIDRWETFGFIPQYWQDCVKISAFDHDYRVVLKMFEWQIDVFDLIEKGLAIDISTLPKSK